MSGLKFAVRMQGRTPLITLVAVLSLALGIGANAAIFSLIHQMLLRSLPVQEPDRLVNLAAPGPKPGSQSCNQAGDCDAVFSYPMFRDLQATDGPFSGVAAHRVFGANLAHSSQTMNGQGMLVSGSYFPVLGVQPALGRLFTPDDDRNIGEHTVAVLSYGYWERNLGADPGVLNQTIVVNGHSMTIVGVAPPAFEGTTLGAEPDVFVPLTMREQMMPGDPGFENRRRYWAYVFARLEPDVTLEQARAQAGAIYSRIINEVEAPLQEGMSDQTMERFRTKPILLEAGNQGQSTLHSEARQPLALLISITAVVLLIACANIANLLLARGAQRSQEMAIRGAMGASRGQLLRQLLTESLVLAALGGVASLFVARWTLGLVGSLMPPEAARTIELGLDPMVVAFAAVLALGTGFIFGFYPALHATRQDLVTTLKANAGRSSASRSAARFRGGLVTGQIALSMALLVAAGLFLRSLVNVSRVDLGLSEDDLVTFTVSPLLNGYGPEETLALFEETEAELAAIPGVTGVSASLVPILAGNSWGTDVSVEGFEWGPDVDNNSRFNEIGAAYFSTLGIPLLAGREFSPSDGAGAPTVAIVNEAFTRKFGLGGRAAVGKWMSTNSAPDAELDVQIVGVVEDAKYSEVKDEVPPLFFTPYRQDETLGWITFYVRSGTDPSQVMEAIGPMMGRLDPNLPVEDLKTLEQQVDESVFVDRLISTLSAAFAVLATLLAAVGLYGVLSYTVAQRTREIGVRMALGAGADRVRGLVLRQVSRMTVVGGILGIVVAVILGRYAEALLYGIEGSDPVVMVAVAGLLAFVAYGAGYIPAYKASRVDPMEALRYD